MILSEDTKTVDFFEYAFIVTKNTFYPRPETEILVEAALNIAEKILQRKGELVLIDVGTGTGCILISIARKIKELIRKKKTTNGKLLFIGTDIDKAAIETATANARINQVEAKFVETDLLKGVEKLIEPARKVDMITSNPPYIPLFLRDKVKVSDPPHTLFGGERGYELTLELIRQSSELLPKDGTLIFEVGYDDLMFYEDGETASKEYKEAIFKAAERYGFKIVKVIKDYPKLERVVILRKT